MSVWQTSTIFQIPIIILFGGNLKNCAFFIYTVKILLVSAKESAEETPQNSRLLVHLSADSYVQK